MSLITSDGSLQRVPFTLQAVPTSAAWLPGLVREEVDEEESPINTSTSSTGNPTTTGALQWSVCSGYPREIALRVLSCSHYHVQAIRIMFHRAKRPSQMKVLAAMNKSWDKNQSGDQLSQYFSARFEPVSAPIHWPPESALGGPLVATDVTIPLEWTTTSSRSTTTQPDGHGGVAFIKLVIHKPHPHPDNLTQQVAIKEIELLGTFHTPSRQLYEQDGGGGWEIVEDAASSSGSLDTSGMMVHQEDNPNPDSDPVNGLRCSLEAAGLPEELILDLLAQKSNETPASDSQMSCQPPEPLPATTTTSTSVPRRPEVLPTKQIPMDDGVHSILDSVFDLAVKDYVQQQAHHDQLFATLATPRTDRVHEPLASSPTASSSNHDVQHYEAIAIHTFGSFFTQSLVQSQDRLLRMQCVRIAERFAPFLWEAGLPIELVHEGLMAVVLLALQCEDNGGTTRGVFHAVLHIVRTMYQQDTMTTRLAIMASQLPHSVIHTGLLRILDEVLASPHCWSLSLGGGGSISMKTTTVATIDRELLKTVRMLLAHTKTRTSLIRAVCSQSISGNQHDQAMQQTKKKHSLTNRLRLMRWILQRHVDKLCAEETDRMALFCHSLTGPLVANKPSELASQCLQLLIKRRTKNHSVGGDLVAQLMTVKKLLLLEESESHGEPEAHTPLFDVFPFTSAVSKTFVSKTRAYFYLHARPFALYKHEFTMDSVADDNKDSGKASFQKGNISFHGHVEAREVPESTFHETINHMNQPFVFQAPTQSSLLSPATNDRMTNEMEMETPFAKFNGTLELRNPPPEKAAQKPPVGATIPSVPSLVTAQPSPQPQPLVRRPSNRVVPVNTSPAERTITTSGSGPSSHTSSGGLERRASTAAPILVATTILDPIATGLASPAKPLGAPVVAAPPKTAPASTKSSSQDSTGGCTLQ